MGISKTHIYIYTISYPTACFGLGYFLKMFVPGVLMSGVLKLARQTVHPCSRRSKQQKLAILAKPA